MKLCPKLPEPPSLAAYRAAQPNSNWEQMRNDPHHGGMQAYLEIKPALVRGQRGLCAYCERLITTGLTDDALNESRARQRVEHFHPKSDVGGPINWALHWPNLWAVCPGGDQKPPEGEPFDAADYLPPLPENLSCDAFKAHQIQIGQLDVNPEGRILAPHEVPAFPRLFRYAPDGSPEPDAGGCDACPIPGNRHADTRTLISESIKHLNLGCVRLNRIRCIAKGQLEKLIRRLREDHVGVNPQELLLGLARRIFSDNPDTPWLEFFTLIRWRLGEPAEARLREMGFAG